MNEAVADVEAKEMNDDKVSSGFDEEMNAEVDPRALSMNKELGKDKEDINKFQPDPQRDSMSSLIEEVSVEETDDWNETSFAELAQELYQEDDPKTREMNRPVSDPEADDMNQEIDDSDLHEMGTELLETDPDVEDMNKVPSAEEAADMNVEIPEDEVHTLMLEHGMVSGN